MHKLVKGIIQEISSPGLLPAEADSYVAALFESRTHNLSFRTRSWHGIVPDELIEHYLSDDEYTCLGNAVITRLAANFDRHMVWALSKSLASRFSIPLLELACSNPQFSDLELLAITRYTERTIEFASSEETGQVKRLCLLLRDKLVARAAVSPSQALEECFRDIDETLQFC